MKQQGFEKMLRNDIIPFYNTQNKIIVKSKDCYLYDSEGKKYVDFESGVWCANIGHSNNRTIKLFEKQIRKSIHHGYNFRNYYSEELSRKLQSLMGIENGSSVFFSSGSEAINLSIALSYHLTGRQKILKIDNSYLSAYGFGQNSAENDNIVNVKFNNQNSIKSIDFKKISALVLETGGASIEMVKFPDYEFVKYLIRNAKENNCLIISDEVTTGIGRLGKWFGYQYYNIEPDIVVVGKALGNGYPVSAVTINNKVLNEFEKNPFRYCQSHQNDPLGCALGLEVIKFIEENDLINECENMGLYFNKQLELLYNKHNDKIKEVRARGLMLALQFEDSFNGERISNKLFENGFVVGFKINTLRFLPPLIISKKNIDTLVKTLDILLRS